MKEQLFRPTKVVHRQTTPMMWDLDVTSVTLLLKEFHGSNKLTSDHLSSECGQLSYDHTTAEHHEEMLGKEATNDNLESPFAILTM